MSQGCLSSNCTHFRSASLGMVDHSSNAYSSKNSVSNKSSLCTEYGTIQQNVLNKNRKNDEHTRCLGCCSSSSSLPNVCDSDNSSSDVNSVNGSCCLSTTKCTLPWANKIEPTKSNDSCKLCNQKLKHFNLLTPDVNDSRSIVVWGGCVSHCVNSLIN